MGRGADSQRAQEASLDEKVRDRNKLEVRKSRRSAAGESAS